LQKSFETVRLPVQPGNDMISVSFFRLFRVMRLVKLLSKETTTPQLISNSISSQHLITASHHSICINIPETASA
jgi:hypothetical protein